MKSCPVCTLQFEDEFLFCSEDGSLLTDSSSACREAISAEASRVPAETLQAARESCREVSDITSHSYERPSHRIAARATAVALVLFGLAASYKLYASLSQKPAPAQLTTLDRASEEQADLFIPTPPAARDYVEEPTESAALTEGDALAPKRGDTGLGAKALGRGVSHKDRGVEVMPSSRSNATSVTQASAVPPDPQQSAAARVTLNLVRIRARRTAEGYQYELTFGVEERTGRAVLWKQLSVTTRSASGLNRSQMMPFSERLDRSGRLTFTVDAVMPGTSESDWRGRIICSSFGVDDTSKVVRATFGTDVSPW